MVFLHCSLLLFILPLLSFSNSSPPPSVLSLKCTQPSDSLFHNKSIQILIHHLTFQLTETRFITSTTNLGMGRLFVVMQCRPNLTTDLYGCYLHYFPSPYAYLDSLGFWSCRSQTKIMEPAIETLLLRLRADIKMISHLGFSTGNSTEVYGQAECFHGKSPEDCKICLGKGVEKLYEICGGREGATVVVGHCTVRYENCKVFSNVSAGGWLIGNDSGDVRIWENNEDGGDANFKVKVAVFWGAAVACFIVTVFCAWLLRRSIINKAKVASFGGAQRDEDGTGRWTGN